MSNSDEIERIAIVGMSGAFPGAQDIEELWSLFLEKREGITTLTREELLASGEDPALLDDPRYIPRGGFVDEAEVFDNDFFGISPSDALNIDPQQRLFLTHARLALEDAGRPPEGLTVPVGVFAAESPTQYWFLLRSGPYSKDLDDYRTMLGNEKDFLATRTSYKLNLKGPSLDVQSACSSGLSAVFLACQSLLSWNCDLALAGASTVTAPRRRGYLAYEGMIGSPTGVCRPFDERADGTLSGEGVGVVVLKRLSEALDDGDFIYAVIDATAMNNDGADKVGFTAPSVNGQAAVIEWAQSLAGVTPDEIGYVEAHGTATPLGDPIEIQALTEAFRKGTDRRQFCHIGSSKANLGHLDAAAGMAALIKASLVVHTGTIPPQLHFQKANPHLGLEDTPFVVPTEPVAWNPPGGRRIAGVSAFGIGGTNVHLILESPPIRQSPEGAKIPPLHLSAKKPESLRAYAARTADFLRRHPQVSAAALVAKLNRADPGHPWRQGFVAESREALAEALEAPLDDLARGQNGAVVFAFPGQGSQFPAMARAYYDSQPVFREWVDRGLALAEFLGLKDLRSFLFEDGAEAEIARTETTQPLLYIVEHALARQLIDRGVVPSALLGHSIGEYVAATIGGALSFDDGLRLVARRGYWMQRATEGAMLAIPGSIDEVARYAGEGIYLSVYNTGQQVVLSGTLDAIADLERTLTDGNVEYKRLRTSHAFHSPLMDNILESFGAEVRTVAFGELTIPLISNLDGSVLQGKVDWNDYWVRQLRQPVRFDQCLTTLGTSDRTVVEVGPGRALTGFIRSTYADKTDVFSLLPNPRTQGLFFESTLARLWERGVPVVWSDPLPDPSQMVLFGGYPFQKKRFWPAQSAGAASRASRAVVDEPVVVSATGPDSAVAKVRSVWKSILGHGDFDNEASFFLQGADSFAGIQLLRRLKETLGLDLTMAELMAAPSVAALASRLSVDPSSETKPKEIPYLFPVQTRGNATPLFMVAGAHEIRYYDLANGTSSYEEDFLRYFSHLIPTLGTDQPLYGFRPKGLIEDEHQHSSVTVMAEAYIRAMRQVQPQGPYSIGGECVGGIVAIEMENQLRRAGETVSRLVLLDTPKPSFWGAWKEELILEWNFFRWNGPKVGKKLLRKGPRLMGPIFSNWLSVLVPLLFPLTGKLRRSRRIISGSRRFQRTLLTHKTAPVQSGVTYLINADWNHRRYMMGWKRELGPDVQVYEIPGKHLTRLQLSGQRIGQIIRSVIPRR